jgi:hypothetical protein
MKTINEVIYLVDRNSTLTPPSTFILSPDNTDEDNEAWLRKVLPDLPEEDEDCELISCLLEAERLLLRRGDLNSFIGVLQDAFEVHCIKLLFGGGQIAEERVFGEGNRDHDAILNQIYAHCEAINLDPGNASWEEILILLEDLAPERVEKLLA